MHFYRTFKDNRNIYFILQYIRGMELFDVIRVIGLCGTKDALFFTGSIILALEYLHHNNIIYRDLKPENIMIDQSGRLILIDLGTGKKLVKKPLKTFTIIGTPHYMAPEVLKNKGYSFLADLWSLGVCLYEFMCGDLPFGEDLDDPYDIYQEVLMNKLEIPPHMQDRQAARIINLLLNKTCPELRHSGSYANLKAHR